VDGPWRTLIGYTVTRKKRKKKKMERSMRFINGTHAQNHMLDVEVDISLAAFNGVRYLRSLPNVDEERQENRFVAIIGLEIR
jgi:hypothetical protein